LKDKWSLVFFTFLAKMAVGSFITTVLFINSDIFTEESKTTILKLIITTSILALLISFFHLGKPWNAYYTLNNIRKSWLSREILFLVLFTIFAVVYTYMVHYSELSIVIAISGSVCGVLAIFSMAKIYMLKTIPIWNQYSTIIQFFSTTIILGIVFILSIAIFYSIFEREAISVLGLLNLFLFILFPLIVINMISFLFMLRLLSDWRLMNLESIGLISVKHLIMIYTRLILSLLSILFILHNLILVKENFSNTYLLLIISFIVASELTARYLFYAFYKRIGI